MVSEMVRFLGIAVLCVVFGTFGVNGLFDNTGLHADPEVKMNVVDIDAESSCRTVGAFSINFDLHVTEACLSRYTRCLETELITSKGYPCEEYDVHTSDGYILGIQRIPHGKNNSNQTEPRTIVLLQHGLFSSSACFVENLANESLAFILADSGFDVWMGNNRGNTYARRHETLDPKQDEFWDFSWDEMALSDLPATIDKVLNVTKATQLVFLGYSQGGTLGHALFSKNKEIQKKVKLYLSVAPAVYLQHVTSPIKSLAPFANDLQGLFKLLGKNEMLPHSKFVSWLGRGCHGKMPSGLCENMLFLLCGYDAKQMNSSRIPVYTAQNPAGSSVRNFIHFMQMMVKKEFQMFDFGTKVNMEKYHQANPPIYPIENVTLPTAIFSGSADQLVVPEDLARLEQATPNIIYKKVITGWEHLDFIWAMNSPPQCYYPIIKLLNSIP